MSIKWKTWPRWKKWGVAFSGVYLVFYFILLLLVSLLDENAFFIAYLFSFPSIPGHLLFQHVPLDNLVAYFLIGVFMAKITSKKVQAQIK